MLLAGSVSLIAGLAYIILSGGADPKLMPIVLYTATGGVDFVAQAWLLARRRHRLATASNPVLSAS